jgi:hypothetical protein
LVVAASFFTLLVLDGTCYTFGVFMEPLRFIRNEKKDLFRFSITISRNILFIGKLWVMEGAR